MDRLEYELFDELNRSGMDNTKWGLCRDVHTKIYFGATDEYSKYLDGQWLFVYDEWPFETEYSDMVSDGETAIYLYDLN